MKRHLSKFSALIAAAAALGTSGSADADHVFQAGLGYRQDTITWDVDRNGLPLPALSDDNLRFYDLDIMFIGGRAKGGLGCLYYRADMEYGWIFNGRQKEKAIWTTAETQTTFPNSSFGNTEKTVFEAAVHNHCKRRYTFDFDFGLGIPFQLYCSELQYTPMIGYSYNTQSLRVKDDEKLGQNFTDVQQGEIGLGSFSTGGHSSYRTSWWGPWIGFDMAYATSECGIYYSEMEFHFARARRQRNSSEGIPLDSYQRTKQAYIFAWKVGAAYAINDCWLIDGSLKYVDGFSTKSSSDQLSWRSGQLRVDVGYRY